MEERETKFIYAKEYMIIFRANSRVPVIATDESGFIMFFSSRLEAKEYAKTQHEFGDNYEILVTL